MDSSLNFHPVHYFYNLSFNMYSNVNNIEMILSIKEYDLKKIVALTNVTATKTKQVTSLKYILNIIKLTTNTHRQS